MRVTPKSEKQIAEEAPGFSPFPVGEYDFEITAAVDSISKTSGADMIKLTLWVFSPEGEKRTVFDYLIDSVPYKIRHAAEACGLLQDYLKGQIDPEDFVGKTGRVKLGIQRQEGYDPRNNVRDYIVPQASAARPSPAKPGPRQRIQTPLAQELDDDIPF